jgi:hypothetical protein
MAGYATDTLVLKIVEQDDKGVDNNMFIFYDVNRRKFYIRGARTQTRHVHYEPYSFGCPNRLNDLYEFISFMICKKNIRHYTMYNHADMPVDSDDITYEALVENEDKSNELFGYDDCEHSNKNLKALLNMLRSVTNPYDAEQDE